MHLPAPFLFKHQHIIVLGAPSLAPLLLAAIAGAAEGRGPRQDRQGLAFLGGEKKEEKGNKLKRIEVKLPRLNCDV